MVTANRHILTQTADSSHIARRSTGDLLARPLTERINDSLVTSRFALAAKRSGHDAIVIQGKARQPSVLIVDEDRIRVEPAGALCGADHNRSGAAKVDFSGRADRRRVSTDSARLASETEDQAALLDSLILCRFLRKALDDFHIKAAEMLRLVTGWQVTPGELRQTARRIVALKRLPWACPMGEYDWCATHDASQSPLSQRR